MKDIFDFIINVGFITLPNFVIIYLWMFYWAIFGTWIFGNAFAFPNEKLDLLVGWNRDYYTLSFNDLGHSLTILFACLVVNNWQYIAWTYIAVLGYASVLYFGAFYLLTCFTMTNIILGFMLDAYFTLKAAKEESSSNEEECDKFLGEIKERLQAYSASLSPSKDVRFIKIVKVKVLNTEKRGFYEAIKLFG